MLNPVVREQKTKHTDSGVTGGCTPITPGCRNESQRHWESGSSLGWFKSTNPTAAIKPSQIRAWREAA